MKRIFIAFDVDEELRSQLEQRARAFMDRLQELREAVRWIPPERYHMTATFLGDTEERDLPRVRDAIEEIDVPKKVEMELGPPLVFPKPRDPRVLVCALREGGNPLEEVSDQLRRSLGKREISFDEKPFRPHLTVGYLRKRPRKVQRNIADLWLREVERLGESGNVTRVGLYESVLSPSGPTYTLLFQRVFPGAETGKA